MTFGILKSRVVRGNMILELQKSDKYQLLGEFYESKTNAQGGMDFLCTELEDFLSKNSNGSEYAGVTDYSHQIARMEGLSVSSSRRSRKKYIQETYDCYLFYFKKE